MEKNDFNTTRMDSRERLRTLYLQPGDIIAGSYEFVCELGHGGMGMVCLCRDLVANGRLMAVKTVPDILRNNDEAVEALTREYDNMYSLTNDGIVAVRHLVKDDFRYYVVMDYVEGETLAAYLAKHRKTSVAVVLEVIRRLAAALDYAHGKGLVHRDIKPGNVMVHIDGNNVKSVKLLDFGLGLQIWKSFSRTTGQLTSGTPAYKSPEQWDPRRYGKPSFNSDQYSLAVMAYEMLSGDYPFAEYDDMETVRVAVLNDEPERIDGIADYMNDTLQKALAKRQEDRFKSCKAFVDALIQPPVIVKQPAPQPQPNVMVLPLPRPVIGEKLSPQPPVIKTPSITPRDITLTLPGNVPLELVHIHAGSFTMGSPKDEPGRYDDEIQHHVTLTKDFWLGKYSVTQGQWKAVMGTTLLDQANKAYPNEGYKHIGNIGDDYPMYWVNWNEASEFCRALTEREQSAGCLPAGYKYVLPTEAQWEYTCRSGTSTALYNGDIIILGENNAPAVDGIAWYAGNSSVGYKGTGWDTKDWKEKQYPGGVAGPRKVGGKKPNQWGLYDMIGNVYEWCRDWDGAYPTGSVTDPAGPSSGSSRVLRGGTWGRGARYCRSAGRSRLDPTYRGIFGFRVAMASVQ